MMPDCHCCWARKRRKCAVLHAVGVWGCTNRWNCWAYPLDSKARLLELGLNPILQPLYIHRLSTWEYAVECDDLFAENQRFVDSCILEKQLVYPVRDGMNYCGLQVILCELLENDNFDSMKISNKFVANEIYAKRDLIGPCSLQSHAHAHNISNFQLHEKDECCAHTLRYLSFVYSFFR